MKESLRATLLGTVVGTAVGTVVWTYDYAAKIWPSHPFLMTLLLTAIACEGTRQFVLHRARNQSN
jgi:hypothetical protein